MKIVKLSRDRSPLALAKIIVIELCVLDRLQARLVVSLSYMYSGRYTRLGSETGVKVNTWRNLWSSYDYIQSCLGTPSCRIA